MKKFIFLFISLMLLASTAYASESEVKSLMSAQTFNAVTTAANSTALYSGGLDRVAFWVNYDETEVGNSISAAVTLQMSFDNSTWFSASFYDYAGGATLQTSETISADGNYYFWVNRDLCAPYYRVVITATNTDADDLLVVTVKAALKG